MKKSNLTLALIAALLLASAPQLAKAEDESDYVTYDSIVDDLQKQNSKNSTGRSSAKRSWLPTENSDPFENIWLHAGVGFVQTTQNISLPTGVDTYMAGRGVQVALGIDILGPNLAAEGTMRSFGESEDTANKVSLKEFDLKVLFKSRMASLNLHGGAGLSARYMTVRTPSATFDVTTPAGVVTLGGDLYITPAISLGLDFSTRTAMITETFDKTSYDGTLRLDTHF